MPTSKIRRSGFYLSFVKPVGDLVVSVMLLVLLFPLLLLFSLVLLVHLQGNPLFAQRRIGKQGRPFQLMKFRTFKKEGDRTSLGRLGRLFRSTSMDELPQLLNILMGHMSFVGPRPLLPEYVEYYTEEQMQRHEVKPGLTGRAQVVLGNSPDWDARFACDLLYLQKVSFGQDILILCQTAIGLFKFRKKSMLDGKVERFDDFAKRNV